MTHNPQEKPISCFSVIEPENERGDIIFAHTDEQAIAIYILRQDELPDLGRIRTIEHPEWAHYATENSVPIAEQIKNGYWRYECHDCLTVIPTDDNHENSPDKPVIWPNKQTFCSCFCAADYISRRHNRRALETAALEWIYEEIDARCPDKTIIDVSPHTTETTIHTIRATIAETADPSQIAFARIDFPENDHAATFTLQPPYSPDDRTSGCFDNLNTALQAMISRTPAP